jgi:hypothetical protein
LEIQVQNCNASEVRQIQSSHAARDFSAPPVIERKDMACGGATEKPSGGHAVLPTDTHWTRILHCDLFTGQIDNTIRAPGDFTAEDQFVPPHTATSAADSRRTTPPIPMIVILYALCIAMYLAIGGVVQAIVTTDSNNIAPTDSQVSAPAGSGGDSAMSAHQRPSGVAPDQGSNRVDISRERKPNATVTSMNTYDSLSSGNVAGQHMLAELQ